jgi:hypothetical protein
MTEQDNDTKENTTEFAWQSYGVEVKLKNKEELKKLMDFIKIFPSLGVDIVFNTHDATPITNRESNND